MMCAGNFAISDVSEAVSQRKVAVPQRLFEQFPTQINRENISKNREFLAVNRGFHRKRRKRPFLTRLCLRGSDAICSHRQIFQVEDLSLSHIKSEHIGGVARREETTAP